MTKDKIRLLPQKVANQIAAGEVVAHPSSVVKEMMENAIDAGATEVVVNYRMAGYDLIQVIDNGSGMSPNDARMAFERHATSKIKSAKDLYALNTFGFRGEALASIAAVAKVELRTQMEGAAIGSVTTIDNGEFQDQRMEMCEKGSQFTVRDIFQEMPARRRFTPSEAKNATLMKNEFRRVALCYPQLNFELYSDGAPIFRLSSSSLAGRIVDIIGRKEKSNLLEISANTVIVNIRGYISAGKSSRSKPDQYMFVNGRYFESKYLASAIIRAYEKILQPGQQPSFFLFFEVKPEDVDVNIHPQKIEIRFAEQEAMWSILMAAARETLARTGAVSLMDFDDESQIEIPVAERGKVYQEPKAISNANYNPFEIEAETEAQIPRDDMDSPDPKSKERGGSKRSALSRGAELDKSWEVGFSDDFEDVESEIHSRISIPNMNDESELSNIGSDSDIYELYDSLSSQFPITSDDESAEEFEDISSEWSRITIEPDRRDEETELPIEEPKAKSAESLELRDITVTNGRYAWCKIAANMSVIDLKRAKERVLYDHYNRTIGIGDSLSQRIIFPIEMELNESEYTTLSENLGEFHMAGFEIEQQDNGRVEIEGIPAGLREDVARELIYEMLQLLSTPEDLSESRREKIAAVMARNGSQNLGRNISAQQAKELLSQLLKCKENGQTADGRRIIWEITPEDIKRRMK